MVTRRQNDVVLSQTEQAVLTGSLSRADNLRRTAHSSSSGPQIGIAQEVQGFTNSSRGLEFFWHFNIRKKTIFLALFVGCPPAAAKQHFMRANGCLKPTLSSGGVGREFHPGWFKHLPYRQLKAAPAQSTNSAILLDERRPKPSVNNRM
jgi:hypothetical protein